MGKKFVAFLDILGFKDLVENNSPETVAKIYVDALSATYENSVNVFRTLPAFNGPDLEVKSTIISDSILIWTENDNMDSFAKLIIIVSSFLYASIYAGIPVRGSIEYDEMIEVDPHSISTNLSNTTPIILGKAIVKAYMNESTQLWAGCTVSEECIRKYQELYNEHNSPDLISLRTLEEFGYLINYNVPRKSGFINEEVVINWPKILATKPDLAGVRAAFNSHSKKTDDWNVEYIIRNTINFLEHSWTFKTIHADSIN